MGSNETAAAATWWQVALQNGQRGGMMALIALMIPLGINTNPFWIFFIGVCTHLDLF